MSPFLQTALDAALNAQEIISHYYRQGVAVKLKADQTPVTVADIEAERAIKACILGMFPHHGFYGEETGRERADAEYVWLIDPIDGTKSFVRGYPFFSTQIALMRDGELVLGVSNAPEFQELAYAEKGLGAYLNQQPIQVSHKEHLPEITLSLGNLTTLTQGERWQGLGRLIQKVQRTRGYGDFYHYHLLASGRIDLVIESDVNILDIAALTMLVNEAGGVFTDLDGQPIGLETTSVLAAANPVLHDKALRLLGIDED